MNLKFRHFIWGCTVGFMFAIVMTVGEENVRSMDTAIIYLIAFFGTMCYEAITDLEEE